MNIYHFEEQLTVLHALDLKKHLQLLAKVN